MKFLSVFKSQIPGIVDRLNTVRVSLKETQTNIEQLVILEKSLTAKEAKAEKQGRILEKAINGFGVAMWAKNLEGRFIYANQTCCDTILKCTRQEALNLKNGDLKKDALARVCRMSDLNVMRDQKTKRFIEHAIYENGIHVFIDTVKSPTFDSKGKLSGTIGSAILITDNIPIIIREQHLNSASIEISVNESLGKEQYIKLLERRKEVRTEV